MTGWRQYDRCVYTYDMCYIFLILVVERANNSNNTTRFDREVKRGVKFKCGPCTLPCLRNPVFRSGYDSQPYSHTGVATSVPQSDMYSTALYSKHQYTTAVSLTVDAKLQCTTHCCPYLAISFFTKRPCSCRRASFIWSIPVVSHLPRADISSE